MTLFILCNIHKEYTVYFEECLSIICLYNEDQRSPKLFGYQRSSKSTFVFYRRKKLNNMSVSE